MMLRILSSRYSTGYLHMHWLGLASSGTSATTLGNPKRSQCGVAEGPTLALNDCFLLFSLVQGRTLC